MDYSVSDGFDVNISVPVLDEEATLTTVKDLYLPTPEPQPPEQLTSEQPLDYEPGPTAPRCQPPEYLTNVPSSGPSEQPVDESLAENCPKVLLDLKKAFTS